MQLADPLVSSEHASLKWANSQWMLRDLGSTNGTWVNGEAIPKGRDFALTEGAAISFGSQRFAWHLADAHPPEPMVAPVGGGQPCFIQDGVIAIPAAQKAVASIFHGSDGSWTLEVGDQVTPIQAGTVFDALGCAWRFSCPTQWQPTVPLQALRLLEGSVLQFEVSRDEESVALAIDTGRELVNLGESNTFYLLLTLARLRQQEQEQRSPAEAGWVHREQLIRMLRCDPQLLNVWVCRIRSKLSSAGFLDYASIIQRRDGSGRMRLGTSNNVIRRLG